MGQVHLDTADRPGRDELIDLYGSVGWTAYTRDADRLERAIAGSSFLATARDSGALVGLVRAVSDGATICFVQDVIVRPDRQRTGIGSDLVRATLDRYRGVRQTVLVTDTEPRQRGFYESLGFSELHEHDPGLRGFIRLDDRRVGLD